DPLATRQVTENGEVSTPHWMKRFLKTASAVDPASPFPDTETQAQARPLTNSFLPHWPCPSVVVSVNQVSCSIEYTGRGVPANCEGNFGEGHSHCEISWDR